MVIHRIHSIDPGKRMGDVLSKPKRDENFELG